MSTHQQTNPRRANQSVTEESARPATERAKVGCDAIDEPWTNNTAGFPSGESRYFSHRNRRTSPLFVQCSAPVTVGLLRLRSLSMIPVSRPEEAAPPPNS